MKIKIAEKVRKLVKKSGRNFPDFNEQFLLFHSSFSQPAYQRAFRIEAFAIRHQLQGNLITDNTKEEDFVVKPVGTPISLKERLPEELPSQGSRIRPEDGNPVQYI